MGSVEYLNMDKMKCAICGAVYGKCDCWQPCDYKPPCGHVHEKGQTCRNPIHEMKKQNRSGS